MKRWHWLALVVVLLGGVAVAQYGGSPGGTDNPLFTSIWVTGAPGVFPGSGCTTYPGGGRVCGDNKGGLQVIGAGRWRSSDQWRRRCDVHWRSNL